jgi:hypothetical protein
MKATLVERNELYAQCPQCGDRYGHRVPQLPAGAEFGTRFCASCGAGVRGYVEGPGHVELTLVGNSESDYVLLRVDPRERPLFLVVQAAHERPSADRLDGSQCRSSEIDPAGGADVEASHAPSSAIQLREIMAVTCDDQHEAHPHIKYTVSTGSLSPHPSEESGECKIPGGLKRLPKT